MFHKRFLLGLILVASVACRCEGWNDEAKNAGGPAEVPMQALPFQLYCGFLIVVEGSIGTAKGLRFILDTGTTRTIVDRSLVPKLGVSASKQGELVNFNRNLAMESVEVSNVRFGPIEAAKATVFVADLRAISDLAAHADAIIGQDLLSLSKIIRIMYPSRTVVFQAMSLESRAKNLSTFASCYLVQATIQDVPLRLVVDTGIEGVILYEDSVRRRLSKLRPMEQVREVRLGGLVLKDPKLPPVIVAGTPLQSRVLVMGDHPRGVPADVDGFLGIAALHSRMIEFDFEKQTIRWE